MSQVIDKLKALNSKERFFLVGYALGNRDFNPSPEFRADIQKMLGIKMPLSVFATMDYHLDWIFAALILGTNSPGRSIYPIEPDCITATQEDIDFLIAYDEGPTCHIILLEAKGVTGWNNSQMNSKARRFSKIFSRDGNRWKNAKPHFAIISPRQTQRLEASDWPVWMAPNGNIPWIQLTGTENHIRIHRCDQHGIEKKDGGYWTTAAR